MNVLFWVQIRENFIELLLDAIDIVHIFDGLVIYWYVLYRSPLWAAVEKNTLCCTFPHLWTFFYHNVSNFIRKENNSNIFYIQTLAKLFVIKNKHWSFNIHVIHTFTCCYPDNYTKYCIWNNFSLSISTGKSYANSFSKIIFLVKSYMGIILHIWIFVIDT